MMADWQPVSRLGVAPERQCRLSGDAVGRRKGFHGQPENLAKIELWNSCRKQPPMRPAKRDIGGAALSSGVSAMKSPRAGQHAEWPFMTFV
jgi:hypothetical protein